MKLGILLIGDREVGKTTTIDKVKERIGISTTQWTFDCHGDVKGFIIAGSWDELQNKYSPDDVHDRLEEVCDKYQVVIIPSWREEVPGSHHPIYVNVLREKKFLSIRLDVMKMDADEAAWDAAQDHLADYVHSLIQYACPELA